MVSTIKFIICVSLVVAAIILSHFVIFPVFIQSSNCDILIHSFDHSSIEQLIGNQTFISGQINQTDSYNGTKTFNYYWNLPNYECSKFFDKDLIIEDLLR